ncbi:hydrolytic protein [Kitasatospora sp. NPDC101157]|uniref:COG1470 family protein n=1 Tax=Kitasatospora sp. NPDC101157 TaxID=3364098 RepID=UPI00381441A6
MTTSAELGLPALTVAPGGVATTTLTVRNDLDIVEAYTLEAVGDCAAWTTVEPARVSLYPGTSETVTVRVAPPRSSAARAGEFPLGIRVLPTERPELVTVPETTVTVTPFHELQAALAPRRRRGWLRGRYRTSVRNLGNTPGTVALTPGQAGEELRFRTTPERLRLEPGESGELRLQARARKLIWFGKPASWPFEVTVGPEQGATGRDADGEAAAAGGTGTPDAQGARGGRDSRDSRDSKGADGKGASASTEALTPVQRVALDGEFIQLPVFPKWLLALLAALLALLLAWFALVRPAVRSSAKQAAEQAVAQQSATPAPGVVAPGGAPTAPSGGNPGGQGRPAAGQPSTGGRAPGAGLAEPGTGRQSSATIDVTTSNSSSSTGSYQVPHGKVFDITDIVAANFQGDQGLLTITAGKQTITTIALETFRNQDYHWVTPIQVPEDQAVTATVTCESPGTPASGKQADTCHELLNISGTVSDIRQGN